MEDACSDTEEMEHENQTQDEEDTKDDKVVNKVYLPGQAIQEGERLVQDESTYLMYHQAQTGSPCLSFDVIKDDLGENRQSFPHSMYIVAATQAEQGRSNHMIVMKMSNLHPVKHQSEKDGVSSDEEDDDDESDVQGTKPEMETAMVKHSGGANRIRCTKMGQTHLAATWSERRAVHIWNLTTQLVAVESPTTMAEFLSNRQLRSAAPLFTFAGHMAEGFAMDWSGTVEGQLLTGDCKHNIHLWKPREGGSWHVDQRPYVGHTDSVEDLQWSPNEQTVFASCSVDQTVRIWDIRANPSKACMLTKKAHDTDVNVLNWNRNDSFIATGDDSGVISIWDLRQFEKGDAIAKFKHHTGPITSIEWHPSDKSVFAASGADDQLTLWDLAVEVDGDDEESVLRDVPAQLLFIHQGQKDIKELHWHPQVPGAIISTASDGFNIFRTISV